MLFVIVTEIRTPVSYTCVHFYSSHINSCPIGSTTTSPIPLYMYTKLCTCTS